MIEPRTGRSDDLQRIHADFPIELTRIDTNYGGSVKIAVILNCFPTNRRNGNRARHMINTCTFGLSVWLSICLAISLAINLAIVSIWLSIWQGFLSAHRD